tara:strand:+ start:548 stop:1546 length:999 start_codon:yes stop_codon:yes gene_type:complete
MSSLKISFKSESYSLKDSFTISRGAKKSAEVITVRISDHNHSGIGECAPNLRYGQTISGELNKLQAMTQALENSSNGFERVFINKFFSPSPARSAIDIALWDLELKKMRESIWSLNKIKKPDVLPTMITLDASSIENNLKTARIYIDCKIFKIKFKGDSTDIDRLVKIREQFPKKRLLIDANESISPSKISEYINYCERFNVEVLEQPMRPEFDNLLSAIKTKTILCADESCSSLKDIEAIEKYYDAVNIKLDKAGGLTEALIMQESAISKGMKTMSGCMLCTSIGIAASQIIAAKADYIDHDAPLFLEQDRRNKIDYSKGNMNIANSVLWG